MNLQLTKTLIDKIKPTLTEMEVGTYSDIDSYHCNLLQFGREKVLLITNDSTLYSFVILGIKSTHFKNIEGFIREAVFKLLIENGFSQNQFEKVLLSMESFTYSKTSNRSVIASMNEMKKYIGYKLASDETLIDINKTINEIIFKKIDYQKPYRLFQQLLEDAE